MNKFIREHVGQATSKNWLDYNSQQLRQSGSIVDYITNFRGLMMNLPNMDPEDAKFTFIQGLDARFTNGHNPTRDITIRYGRETHVKAYHRWRLRLNLNFFLPSWGLGARATFSLFVSLGPLRIPSVVFGRHFFPGLISEHVALFQHYSEELSTFFNRS
ncbi:hypothetical protein [Absidia glauca]|uniref:Uncharacterized protein n=1 Tax=Absidia glauca TaxID=4829 RepID=A0A168MQP0_ABSGL|nr:hypothetical protein [Absidia glauca]